MPMIGTAALQTLRAFLLTGVAFALDSCAITIERPTNNATIPLPTTNVVVTGNASFTGLRVTVDGADVSNLMTSTGASRATGALNLPLGPHTITASAAVSCWYCPSRSTQSSSTRSFVVVSGNTQTCARSSGPPVITLDPNLANVGQQPGRQQIGYQLQSGDGVLIIVDDAPGLLQTQMLVEVDIDPNRGVTTSRKIEAWSFCQGSTVNAVQAGMAGGFSEGVVCNPLTAANDFRSGCTTFSPPMLLNQATTSELWLRREPTPGIWNTAEGIDQSIWRVFGGRRLRFIWFH